MNRVKVLRENKECAIRTHAFHDDVSRKAIAADNRAKEKEAKETVDFFVSEIERYKAQMERLKKTGNKDDELRCKYFYEKLIGENINAMKAKFSEEKIKEAQDKYNKNPIWAYILDGNQK